MKKLTWNTEIGRQMWLEGKKDSEIADEFGIAASTVAAYRKRHWEKFLPQQALNAIQKNAKEAGGESQLAAGAVVKINEMLQGESASVAPMSVTAPITQESRGSALEGMKPVPPAMIVGPGGPLAKMDLLAGVKKQLPNVMDVMAAATDHLNGMKAVCTACAIQALWFWRSAEDLLQAKRNIDYLLQLLEEKDGTN